MKVEEGRAFSSCIAGSIKRGKTAEEDEAYGQSLLNDPKMAENTSMLSI